MSRTSEAEQLRAAFTEAAQAITPSPAPLAAIERTGRARQRRRTTTLTLACALLLTPLAVTGVRATLPEPTPTERTGVATPPPPLDTVRVVAPGERIAAGAGVELWLTKEGKHWSTPEMDHQFQSAPSTTSIGATMETLGNHYFLSGTYATPTKDVRIVVTTNTGKQTASTIHLPGTPTWGAWYTALPLHKTLTINKITLYNTQGKELTHFTPTPP
ncbi:hypothetical protein ACIQAC_14640 [Streptomyces sp. NPDC088387]|uniref:hypothetical protein n=1 Tax=Streptomyces sp. NPDC088387 TaxID=3365859 RepID=UPI00380CF8CA